MISHEDDSNSEILLSNWFGSGAFVLVNSFSSLFFKSWRKIHVKSSDKQLLFLPIKLVLYVFGFFLLLLQSLNKAPMSPG